MNFIREYLVNVFMRNNHIHNRLHKITIRKKTFLKFVLNY